MALSGATGIGVTLEIIKTNSAALGTPIAIPLKIVFAN